MATSALQPVEVEQAAGGGSRGAGVGVIQGKGRACDDRFERNSIPIEPRYEIIDDVIYMMASPKYWHHRAVAKMHIQLDKQLAPYGCEVFIAPFDVYLFWEKGDHKNYVEPDLFIGCDQEQLKRFEASEQDYYHGAPKFVVEVLSPSNGEHDLVRKAELYYRAGVAEYWAIEPVTRTLHIFTLSEHGMEYQVKILGAKGSIPLVSFPGCAVDFSAIFPEEQDSVQSD